MNWYIVSGRLLGDDEDTSLIIKAKSRRAAVRQFAEAVGYDHTKPDDKSGLNTYFVNACFNCGQHKPKDIS